MGLCRCDHYLEVSEEAPALDFARAVPAMLEALLPVFAPLELVFAADGGPFVRLGGPVAGGELWAGEEDVGEALTRARPGAAGGLLGELAAWLAEARPRQLYLAAEGALLHLRPGTSAPAWYGRWAFEAAPGGPRALHELVRLMLNFDAHERVVEVQAPAMGYPLTASLPLREGRVGEGDPAAAAANRALLFPALARIPGALGVAREHARWVPGYDDYGWHFPDDAADIQARWLPLLNAR